jgi:S1-C subfamily serine protease
MPRNPHRVLSGLLLLLAALASFAASNAAAQARRTTAEIYEKSKQSIVLLLAYDSAGIPSAIGTGFFVEPTKIATNAHVVRAASKVVYRILGVERTFTAREISNFSETLDLAVLEAAEEGTPLRLSTVETLQVGERVVVIGNPRGLQGSVSEGIVAGIRGTGASRLIQITAPISPGSSGGPVFNLQGEVIGLATATLRDSQNINFAVPSSLLPRLRAAGKSWEPQIRDRGGDVRRAIAGVEFVEIKESIGLDNVDYSIQNKNAYAIKNLRYLVVLRNRNTRNVVSYKSEMVTAAIPPGLALRMETRLDGGLDYSLSPKFPQQAVGELEFRVLTYDVDETDATGSHSNDALLR